MKLDDATRMFLDSKLTAAVKQVDRLLEEDPPLEDGAASELYSVLVCDLRREKGLDRFEARDLVEEYIFEMAKGHAAELYVNSIP